MMPLFQFIKTIHNNKGINCTIRAAAAVFAASFYFHAAISYVCLLIFTPLMLMPMFDAAATPFFAADYAICHAAFYAL